MNAYTLGFLAISLFTLFVGVAALVFISFDERPQPTDEVAAPSPITLTVVRRVDTRTIETVNSDGERQHWQRTEAPHP